MSLILKRPARHESLEMAVGVGTGAEIFPAKVHPEVDFPLGLDPSLEMLNVCRERIKNAGLKNRCEFVGYWHIQDLTRKDDFDAALSILVAHFVKREESC